MPLNMDYIINVTKIRKEEFNTIVVWLTKSDEYDLTRIRTDDLTYAVICYKDFTTHALHLYEGDEEMVSLKLIQQFKNNFESVTQNILAVTSHHIMAEMMDTVELFIRGYVYKLRDELGYI
jgi:hypothetical protein